MNFGTTAAVWLTATAVESTTTGDAGTTLPPSPARTSLDEALVGTAASALSPLASGVRPVDPLIFGPATGTASRLRE